jgi:hypothetical protein
VARFLGSGYPWGVRTLLLAALSVGLGACSSGTEPASTKDLPSDWADALEVTDLVQVECATSDFEFADESASFQPGRASLAVTYDQAHFRCAQNVEGFYKVTGDALEILVQPIDMHPQAVAACDCVFGITFTVEPLASGVVEASLYRRWDDWNTPNDPVEIASEQVTID